MISIEIYT